MNIRRLSKSLFIIDGVLLKLKLDTTDNSCKICYYNGFSCDMEGYELCNFLKSLDNDFLNDEFHLQSVKSLILISKVRNDKYK